jgi:AraC family transcriptional regulator, regulatory protein of adaptative response / methylated-DNA-[protein]-cysteine methyltransferase
MLVWGTQETAFGPVLAAFAPEGCCRLDFVAPSDVTAALQRWQADWPQTDFRQDQTATRAVRQFAAPVAVLGTDFQVAVWQALLQIPAGKTTSYGQLAARLGKPTASRAVGRAVGSNPVCGIIPCHRVLASDGRLHGYHWGLAIKQALLDAEGASYRP